MPGSASPTSDGPSRVVSLVPSLTEAVAATAPELLVGATDWCSHPAGEVAAEIAAVPMPRDLVPELEGLALTRR